MTTAQYYKMNERILKRNIKKFKAEDPEAARIRRDTYCKVCVWKVGQVNGNSEHYTCGCDYIGKTGKIRPCAPSECVEQGIFRERKGEKDGKEICGS